MPELVVEQAADPICELCHSTSDACECPTCDGCEETVASVCSNCDECPSCCSCSVCSADNDHRVNSDDICSHCNECSNCCNCSRPDCGCVCDLDADEGVCSTCDRCDSCCNCSTCEHCGEHFESVCGRCECCDDHCECSTCAECGDSVRTVCSDCERCNDCGCNCDEDEEEAEDDLPAIEVPSTETVTVTFDPPRRDLATRCATCGNRTCVCRFCWDRVDGERPKVRHTYNDAYGDNSCPICHTCHEHCKAEKVCASCDSDGQNRKHHTVCALCNLCVDHCTCRFCGICVGKVIRSQVCTTCGYCLAHCRCPVCQTCREKGKGLCQYCRQCKVCCALPESPCGAITRGGAIPYVDQDVIVWQRPESRPPTMTTPSSNPTGLRHFTNLNPGFQRNPSARELGVEIETNGCSRLGNGRKLWDSIQKWKVAVKPDGSIGPAPAAFELNLMPSCGDVFLTELEEICEGLKEIGANPNSKCGIHVHVNAADVHGDDLKRIIDVYARVERAMFDLCAPRRLNYNYALVCGKLLQSYGNTGKEIRRNIIKKMYNDGVSTADRVKGLSGTRKNSTLKSLGEDLKYRKSINRCDSRYRALNLASYYKRGTIEFRHFEGMIDFKDISGWAMTCGHVLDAAVRMSARQIAVLPTNSRKALLAVLPEWHHAWIVDRWRRMDIEANATCGHQDKRKQIWPELNGR